MAQKTKQSGSRWPSIIVVVVGLLLGLGIVYGGGRHEGPGTVTAERLPAWALRERRARQRVAVEELFEEEPNREILFGDLHVHTTFSADAFMMSLPLLSGEGAHPPADACDFARFCSGLDFFALTDHAEGLTPAHWRESIESIRRCNEVAGDPDDPDLVAFIGWEWSQVGLTPEDHYGHRNVIFRDLEDERLPTRPIAAGGVAGGAFSRPPTANLFQTFMTPVRDFSRRQRYLDLARYVWEARGVDRCDERLDVRALPSDCREFADTPGDLFARLDQWGFPALVIPHGTTWGFYTPPGYTWDKGLRESEDDRDYQRLFEVYSGHGNSEEYRPYRAIEIADDGSASCPEPTEQFEPCCWRAGEIIRSRCGGASSAECERRVREARANYVAVGVAGHLTVPGASVEDWGDCGQCRDCFEPTFNMRPGGSAQYVLARGNFDGDEPRYAQMGFIASSDNHTARPGTGYKEYARRRMTEAAGAESEAWRDHVLGERAPVSDQSVALSPDDLLQRPPFAVVNLERQASFFLTGGLVAVHSLSRRREDIFQALDERRVYGTSGPRILLWFELVNAPRGRAPMGSDVRLGEAPRFVVRAVGSYRQRSGCPDWSTSSLSPERLEHLCGGECYHPSDERLTIRRIEVVRIRPQLSDDEPLAPLIEDVWRSFPCEPSPAGCIIEVQDEAFVEGERDVLYYVRAIQEPTPTVNAGSLRCDQSGCDPCYGDYRTAYDDDCLERDEHRAWSSPIWVHFDASLVPTPGLEPSDLGPETSR